MPTRPRAFIHRRPRPRGRGFTLIEVLTVITILTVLASIAFVAFSGVAESSRVSATRVTLGNAAGMLTEFETAAGGLGDVEDLYAVLPVGKYGATEFTPEDPGQIIAPDGTLDEGSAIRYRTPAFVLTQRAMKTIYRVPAARTMADNLPADAQMAQPPATAAADAKFDFTGKTGANTAFDPATERLDPAPLADAWGNPIIYVPANGLVDVELEAHPGENHRITSRSIVEPTSPTVLGPVPVGSRPFFASAGPDGDFSKGDDNVYSFEN